MTSLTLVDSQVHAYERNHPDRPWAGTIAGPAEVTGDDMVAAMDNVGVSYAVLVSPYVIYQYDGSYVEKVGRQHPDRFGLIKPVDVGDPEVGDVVAEWARIPGTIGIRVLLFDDSSTDAAVEGFNRALTAAEKSGLPVNIAGPGRLEQVGQLAAQHPNVQFVIDHLGLHQPVELPIPSEPFADLPQLLRLAHHENVAVKVSGVCTLSHEPFPFSDIWGPVEAVLEKFGVDRCMWGSDWTRTEKLLTYGDAVDAFVFTDRLSQDDRTAFLGGTLRRIYGWPVGSATR